MSYYNNPGQPDHRNWQQTNGQAGRVAIAGGRREGPRHQYRIQTPSYAHPTPQSTPIQDCQYEMSGKGYNNRPPTLGATFMPGGADDYYAPDIVSPAPQRVMNDVESNMQEGLAHLELESRNPPAHRMGSMSSASSVQSPTYDQFRPRDQYQDYGAQQQHPGGPSFTASYEHTNASAYQNINGPGGYQRPNAESPKFSPFPKPNNPGPNVPLSDDDKEEVLERARPIVLKTTDPEMQLAWAQDALAWVETAKTYSIKLEMEGQTPRSITPKIEHSLRKDATNIVTFLAEQHHPKAEFMKGMWLEFGKFGYRVDKKEAFLGYRRAAEKGYARAEYRIGMQYENSNDSAKAVNHYKRGVAMGDSASNYRLGMMTVLGQHHMPQNYQAGVDLIRYAADTADENAPQGAYVYGMLLAGELPNINIPERFLPRDLNDAKLFIEKAAYLGFAKAQLKMAQAYELCQLGCEFEPTLSLHYNALAARQGEAEADMAISKWFLCGFEDVFEKNEELAFTYAKRAAATGMATAEFALGYFYEIGIYVPKDLHESESWYAKASQHGNQDALGRIDSIKKNNTLSRNDHEKVAINRIKSTRGSQRGGRPPGLAKRLDPMPSISDNVVDMPDPRHSYSGTGEILPLPNNRAPQRPISVAPYPEDDMMHPPRLANGPGQGQGLRPNPRVGPQADRPTSAFGIRHTNTGLDPGQHGGRPQDPMRPSTSMGNMHVPGGRGGNPAGRERVVSVGWDPQAPSGYRQPSPGVPPKLPPIDAGGPVNFEQTSNRLQKAPPANMNRPPAQPQGYGQDPSRQSVPQQPYGYSRESIVPTDPGVQRRDNNASRPVRGSSMTPTPNPAPLMSPVMSPVHSERYESVPSPAQSRASQRPPQQPMSSQGHPSSRPSSAAPSTASSAPSTASGAPKKVGPATFEEMGIPAGKSDDGCVCFPCYVLLLKLY
ncbi:Chitin synthase regulatory factor 4 [Lachnellula arida]|uniref:Chitin synthase regulatory factor 4 n=1 Tax=Lachnellula arida TaxID=1316785 RepID=A0A8T9BEB4_9HELO|nr:Chitin synthase regulatory factor 4 [Lachnellula arida]